MQEWHSIKCKVLRLTVFFNTRASRQTLYLPANHLKTHQNPPYFGTVVQASALDGGGWVPELYLDHFLARPGTTGKFMELV